MKNILLAAEHEDAKKSTKNLIVSILKSEWPLSAKKIYNKAKKNGSEISYQAVHKALRELAADGVLKKDGSCYLISVEWISRTKNFLESLQEDYLQHSSFHLPGIKEFRNEGETQAFVFETLGDAEKYRKKLQWEYLSREGKKPPYCGKSRHLKSPIIYSEKSLNILGMIRHTKTDCYIAVSGSTDIDEWCARYYRNEFVRVRTGLDEDINCEIMVIGDIVTQVFVPKEVQEYIDSAYGKAKTVSDVNVPEFYRNVYDRKADVRLVVLRNPEIAEQLRRQIMDAFSRKEKVAIFDVDGTLVEGFTIIEFASYLCSKGAFPKERHEAMLSALAEYKAGKANYIKSANAIIGAFASGIRGKEESAISRLAAGFVRENRLRLFSYSKKILGLVGQKMKTIAVSGSPDFVFREMRGILPFDKVIASEFEVKDGVFTGRIARNMVADGKVKARALTDYLKSSGLSLEGSVGFGDTQQDLSFLNLVSLPIAVNPNPELENVAKKNGWLMHRKGDDEQAFINKLSGIVSLAK